jgi:hypothetical protein
MEGSSATAPEPLIICQAEITGHNLALRPVEEAMSRCVAGPHFLHTSKKDVVDRAVRDWSRVTATRSTPACEPRSLS